MMLNSQIPPNHELLHQLAEKKLDYLLTLNRLSTRMSKFKDTACDLIAISGDERWFVQVKWFETVDSARRYYKRLRETNAEHPSRTALAIVIDRGDKLFVDDALKNILTTIPNDTEILSIDSLVATPPPAPDRL